MPELVLGPLFRHVGPTHATAWVETDAACEVEVSVGETAGSSRTFRVGQHHYALVPVTGLDPGSLVEYEVRLDETRHQPWWNAQIIGGNVSYWIYQYIGDLSPKH